MSEPSGVVPSSRRTRGRLLNLLFTVSLAIISLACYILLIMLYVRPELYHIPSLVYVVGSSSIKPTVAVGLITAVLAAATSALITRCVEHSLWLKLAPRHVRRPLTGRETRHLAQWSVSPLARLTYAVNGRFWLVKMSGLLLLAVSIMSPVLLVGISQTDLVEVSYTTTSHVEDYWAPWINRGNYRSRGGSAGDLTFGMAVQASNGNFAPPVAPVCSNDSCSVSTTSPALLATCDARAMANTKGMGLPVCDLGSTVESDMVTDFCSSIVPSMCVNLTCGAPSVYANFKTGLDYTCESGSGDSSSPTACLDSPGSWSVIFGAWVGGVDFGVGNKDLINTVSCLVQYGNVTITQTGENPPQLDRGSFKRSPYLLGNYSSPISGVRTFTWGENSATTPYSFTLRVVGTGFNDMYQEPFASGLLGDDASNDAEHVARQIEQNFDWATMGAFARMPNASDVVTTNRTATRVYVYNQLVLLILLAPFLASIMGTWGRWKVGSDDDVPGYDPAAIAARGPVEGVSPTVLVARHGYRKACDKLRLVGFEESVVDPSTGQRSARLRLLAQ
ncbi:uncharacterized protein F5Z01DRAFT_343249 [Emericellopsis atlantica]|uniref:Uncharacterized protein n=1 Tax=Emericellopsis atlantica TaxID=2614577 RepID=A0A9P7ZFM4_9HYPO|nr:uncharacterized protein F5Z01DRAFT_343249 [Emericellopsis atlantica]KAG9250836.1 hypothetical protein F5Z01DRAFT_343249 [Emericellopsis atlantica]